MKIFLVGVSCVGKTTIGRELATTLGYNFYDLDIEIEKHFKKPIPRIKTMFLTDHSYRTHVAIVLKKIITENKNNNYIVALPPSGLSGSFSRALNKEQSRTVIVLSDRPVNILNRLVFFDDDSNKIETTLTEKEKAYYLKEIRKDINYFNRTYKKAKFHIDLDGLSISESVEKIKNFLVHLP